MKKFITALALTGVMGLLAHAQTPDLGALTKGDIIVKDFGETVGLDELRKAFKENNITVNRIRRKGSQAYQVSSAVYRGDRYALTISRSTGKITWITKYGLGVKVFD